MSESQESEYRPAHLFDPKPAQTLSDAEAASLASEFEIPDWKKFQFQFGEWARAYRNGKAWRDDRLSPAKVRAQLRGLTNHAKKLGETLASLDGTTLRVLSNVEESQHSDPEALDSLSVLRRAGFINMSGAPTLEAADLEAILSAVHFLAANAEVKADAIDAAMKKHNSKTPPRDYQSQPALRTLVINIRCFWCEVHGKYSRHFDNHDPVTEKSGIVPLNQASKFTVECVGLINPDIGIASINRAMQDCIEAYGATRRPGEK